MIPHEDDLMFCIMRDGEIIDGGGGLAIGATEWDAWERAINPCEEWSIQRARDNGDKVVRCAIMVVNP